MQSPLERVMPPSLPKFVPPESDPSILDLLKIAPQDPARVIPSSIYSDWSYKMPAPGAPLVISEPEAAEQVLFDQARFGRNPDQILDPARVERGARSGGR